MILSERGAISSAIADGGFHLYPAGRLIEMIKAGLSGDDLKGDFDPSATIDKLSRLQGPDDNAAREIFGRDMKLLCERLSKMRAEYDIESVFDSMMAAVPAVAKRYYSLSDFEAPRPKVVEYYFEGISDLYKDGDWIAFNVNSQESRELGVPVGTYFKRSQVAPGMPEFAALHEANHAMQAAAGLVEKGHHYIPWMDEGLADVLGRMMLFRATGDEALLKKVKNFRTEVEVTDPRKVTYHYGDETAALIILRGRLPFLKALIKARCRDPFAIDWAGLANRIKDGWDPHIALAASYTGGKQDAFRKRVERDEASFRKEADLDQSDLRMLSMFLATTPPACLNPAEYNAGLWLAAETAKNPNPHLIESDAIPAELRSQVNGWTEGTLIPAANIPENIWKKAPELSIKLLIREDAIPDELKASVTELSNKYFIIKRKIGEVIVFEPYGGGLPYRIGTGEIRCAY